MGITEVFHGEPEECGSGLDSEKAHDDQAQARDPVKRVGRGDSIELVARSLGVSAANFSHWLKRVDHAVLGALKDDECDGSDLQIKDLRSKEGDLTMILEV